MDDFTTVKIRRTTLERVRKIAKRDRRSTPQQLDVIIDMFEQWQIVSVSSIPHPPDAEPVPLITVAPASTLAHVPEA